MAHGGLSAQCWLFVRQPLKGLYHNQSTEKPCLQKTQQHFKNSAPWAAGVSCAISCAARGLPLPLRRQEAGFLEEQGWEPHMSWLHPQKQQLEPQASFAVSPVPPHHLAFCAVAACELVCFCFPPPPFVPGRSCMWLPVRQRSQVQGAREAHRAGGCQPRALDGVTAVSVFTGQQQAGSRPHKMVLATRGWRLDVGPVE